MFYVDLATLEENSIVDTTSSIDETCGVSGDNINTPSDRQPVKKEMYSGRNPVKYLFDSLLVHQDDDTDKEGANDLPTPLQPIRTQSGMVSVPEQCESLISEFSKQNENGETDENLIENDAEMSLKKRMLALHELVATEESYVQDLSLIVDGYIREMKDPESDIPLPDDLKGGKERMIFGNVEAIYEWHRDTFLKLLQRCIQCPNDLGPFIQKCKPKLRMYVIYCQNKPVSEHIVAEHLGYFEEVRLKLKHKLVISALLIKPVQRIMKYELLLREFLKHTERAGLVNEIPNIQEAINVMKEVPKEANDMMDVGRLKEFEGKITAQGKLLLNGPLLCTEIDFNETSKTVYRSKDLQVFLFEKNIILSEIVGKKTQFTSPTYIYKAHVQINKMEIEKLSYNRILLRSTDPQRKELSFVLTAQTQEEYLEWVDKLTKILETQNEFLNAIRDPIAYQKRHGKET